MKLDPLRVADRPNLAAATARTNTPSPPRPHRPLEQRLPPA